MGTLFYFYLVSIIFDFIDLGKWFDILNFLDLKLSGILIHSLPILGPAQKDERYPLEPLHEKFKVIGYVDDIKPAICNLEEFEIGDGFETL